MGVHLAVLKSLPKVIDNSIEGEVHPDYKKDNGKRIAENGVLDENTMGHRFYAAIRINGVPYRVKTTIKETRGKGITPYNYQVTELELLKSGSESSDALSNSNYVNVANLLRGVEKSYDKGKKLLDESKITENPSSEQESQLTDVSAKEAEEDDLFRTNDQANDKISANDLVKLGAADRQAVIGYLDKMPSAPISVISNAEDIESQVDLSKEAKMELSELLSDGDTLAGYCRESKKNLYICKRNSAESGRFYIAVDSRPRKCTCNCGCECSCR